MAATHRTLLLVAALALAPAPDAAAQNLQLAQTPAAANRGVVEIEATNPEGISPRMLGELADLIDDGATRRVVPTLGKGALLNVADLKSLRGIDMAIVQADVLDYVRAQKLIPAVDTLTYVAKLYNEEFHLLARSDIKSVADLAGKKVNFDRRGSGTGVTAQRLFGILKVAVEPTYFGGALAIDKLEKGEIQALAFVTGKPTPLFLGLGATSGLHLVPIPLDAAVTAAYVPTRLTAEDYPGLVPAGGSVDTVAVGAVLVVANLQPGSERYRNVANFVDAFFTQFPTLLQPGHHAKWREVNLASEVPGWHRYPPADQWLKRNAVATAQANPQDMKKMFERFLEERLSASRGGTMSQQQKDELFNQFERWQTGQQH